MIKNTSLDYYSSRNPLNAQIAENMLDVTLMQKGFESFEKKACNCFSKAYEICKVLIEESPISVWKVPDFYNDAAYIFALGGQTTIMKAVTISIVLILSEHFDEKWRQENQKFLEKLKDGLKNLELSEEKNENVFDKSIRRAKGIENACINAYRTLRRGTDIDYIIPFEEFSTKIINDTRVSVSGENNITREELKKVIEDAVKDAFDKHKKENDEEKEITNEDIKKAWEQALANAKAEIESKIPRFEYDEKNEGLKIITGSDNQKNRNNESLVDIIKTTVKEYLDDELEASDADIDEIFADVYGKDLVDRANREMSEDNKQTNQLPISNIDDSLQQQLADAQKTIEEQTQTIKELQAEKEKLMEQSKQPVISANSEDVEKLKADLEHYKSIYETCYAQVRRYEEELGSIEELDDWQEQLSIKERIILFQALTGCSLKGVDKKVKQASQLAKAKLIARFSGNNPSKIRSGINLLYSEIEEVESKKRKDFSKGTKAAALNVYNFLHLAVEGTTIGSKPNRCQIAMQTIDQTYHLNIDRAVAPPKDESFLIEQEPQDE